MNRLTKTNLKIIINNGQLISTSIILRTGYAL